MVTEEVISHSRNLSGSVQQRSPQTEASHFAEKCRSFARQIARSQAARVHGGWTWSDEATYKRRVPTSTSAPLSCRSYRLKEWRVKRQVTVRVGVEFLTHRHIQEARLECFFWNTETVGGEPARVSVANDS